METTHSIKGGNGLVLSVKEKGQANGPAILLIHGFSQCHLGWWEQLNSNLVEKYRLVALDIRGHGMSEKPLEPENYTDSKLWADDIASVVDHLKLTKPVLVGWSYGGYIISDYIKHYGDSAIAGINFVCAAVKLTESFDMLGPGFLENAEAMLAPDLLTNILGIRNFLRACTAEPLSADQLEMALAYNMVVPAQVRVGLASRQLDYDDVLSGISVPTLVTIGTVDTVVLPAMGEHIAKMVPNAEVSRYEGVGHAPPIESSDRFNSELASFVVKATSD